MKSEKSVREIVKISFETEAELFEFFKVMSLLGLDERDSNGYSKFTRNILLKLPTDQIDFDQTEWNGNPFSPDVKRDKDDIKREYIEHIQEHLKCYGFDATEIQSVNDLELEIYC